MQSPNLDSVFEAHPVLPHRRDSATDAQCFCGSDSAWDSCTLYLLLNWLPTLLIARGLSHPQAAAAQIGFNVGGTIANSVHQPLDRYALAPRRRRNHFRIDTLHPGTARAAFAIRTVPDRRHRSARRRCSRLLSPIISSTRSRPLFTRPRLAAWAWGQRSVWGASARLPARSWLA